MRAGADEGVRSAGMPLFWRRVGHKAVLGAGLLLCVVAGWVQALQSGTTSSKPVAPVAVEWPHQWEGEPLRPLALSRVERAFAERFPGTLGRFSRGEQVLVLRQVAAATRMLHPATDCYRAAGYRIAQARLEQDARQRLWRCFVAIGPDGTALRVCERIEDADGRGFTDTSGWYWAAVSGRSRGPWQAVTTAAAAPPLRSVAGGRL